MPLTPETWRGETLVNSTSSGTDTDSQIIQLTNGNILIVWTAYNGTDYDIWGRIYDPFGAEVSGELYLATTSNQEDFPAIDALPDGGFVLVHEDDTGSFDDLRLRQFDANGVQETSAYPFFDPSSGQPNAYVPEIATSSSTSTLVVWHETSAGDTGTIMGRIWNSDTETFSGASFSLFAGGGAGYTYPYVDITVLENGNYAIVAAQSTPAGYTGLFMRIVTPTGANVLAFTPVANTASDTNLDYDPSITALTGGGYVIAWRNQDTNDDDIYFQVFDASGSNTTGVFSASFNGVGDFDNEPEVVALDDGGFLVIYDDDGTDDLTVQRYNSTGSQVGSEIQIAVGAGYSQPSATLLADGRVAISYTFGGQIYTQIIDTRDNATEGDMPLNGDEYNYWVGTVGDDTFTVSSGRGDVHGWDGNDDITESGAIRNYFGGEGDDTLRVSSVINSDLHDGGNGNDLIDFSGSGENGLDIDLTAELVTDTNGNTEEIISFENAIGTSGNDTITDRAVQNNLLTLGAGDDLVNHLGGQNSSGDTIFGGAGDDTVAQTGSGWSFHFYGGDGIDTADFSGTTYTTLGMLVDLAAQTYDYLYIASRTAYGVAFDIQDVENVIGSVQ
ncbi:MAG: hypothetical protein ABGX15_13850, partial [Paracoccaceae bacterium]